MTEFKKGQLVAVRDGAPGCIEWHLRQYVAFDSKNKKHVTSLIGGGSREFCWDECIPAEDVWPGIFIGWERSAREQSDHAVAMESALVQRLRRQIEWLCKQLAHAEDMCPSVSAIASCDNDCASCWEQASLKAVEEEQC